MGKIALFLPDDNTLAQARQILQNREYEIDIIKRVETKQVVEEAQKCGGSRGRNYHCQRKPGHVY